MDKNKGSLVYFDEDGLHVGSHVYLGVSVEDILEDKRFACKIKHYSNGKTKTVYCNNWVFRPAIYGNGRNPSLDNYDDDNQEKIPIDENRDRFDNVKRAFDRIFDIADLNIDKFKLFVTVTFDDEKVNAKNAAEVITKLRNWLSHQVQRKGLVYLLVPELHKSGRIHCHMLCNNVFDLVDSGTRVVEGFTKPIKLSTIERYNITQDRIKSIVYNVKDWKVGFSTAILTYGDGVALAHYISKYMTKADDKIFGKRYWCSRNIQMYPVVEFTDWHPHMFNRIRLQAVRCWFNSNEYKYTNNMTVRIE